MKNRGFTLVELLAMLVVLGILMGITIPNITGILTNQRIGMIRNDAVTMIETAKTKVASDEMIKKPASGHCLVFSLDYLNDNGNIETGPNGGKYDEYESFVVYSRVAHRYEYYVRIVEKNDGSNYGIELDKLENINEDRTDNIKNFSTLLGLSKTSTNNTSIVQNYVKTKRIPATSSQVVCSVVDRYYVGYFFYIIQELLLNDLYVNALLHLKVVHTNANHFLVFYNILLHLKMLCY